MTIGHQNRTIAVSILQIVFSPNTECVDMTGFPWPGHIYVHMYVHMYIHTNYIAYFFNILRCTNAMLHA